MLDVDARWGVRVEDSRWERFGALGGVVFVVLDVTIAVLGGEPPAADAARSEVAGYYADKRAAIGAGVVSAVAFVGSAVFGATGSDDVSSAIGLAGFALWCVWILGVSSSMWTDPRLRTAVLAS